MFAMWQAIYPESYAQDQTASGSSYTIASGSTQGADSRKCLVSFKVWLICVALTPFHSDVFGTFWTPNSVRSTETFHYTYPEFVDSDGSASAMMQYVNNLYGPNAAGHVGSSKARREVPTGMPLPTAPLNLLTRNGSRYEYIANIASSRFGLNGPYNIFIFMNSPTSEDPSTWAFDSRLIGTHGVFAQSGMTMNDLVVTGAVPLTQALTTQIAAGSLDSLDELLVVPFLQQQLNWRIATVSRPALFQKRADLCRRTILRLTLVTCLTCRSR